MDRDVWLLVVGALIGLLSSLATSLVQHLLAVRMENLRYRREVRDQESQTIRAGLTQGLSDFDEEAARLRRLELRQRLLRGEGTSKIEVPPGRLACLLESMAVTLESGMKTMADIEVGDKIITLDLVNRKLGVSEVIGKMVNRAEGYISVNHSLFLTAFEVVYIKVGDVITATRGENIRLGSTIVTDKAEEEVTSLTQNDAPTLVYSIRVDGDFPFYAGGYLVGGYTIESGIVTKT